jgi:hypothetical protein
MRRLLAISLAVLLSAPVMATDSSARTRTLISAARAVAAAMTATFVVKHIRAKLAKVRAGIPARRAELHSVRCGSEECYEPAEVTAAIMAIRKDVEDAFPADRAVASRISLDEEILKAAAVVAREPHRSIQLISNAPHAAPATIDSSTVETIFSRISDRIDHYLAHPKLNPNIRLNCNVVGATFEMQVGDNAGTKQHALTNHELPSVWRGYYRSHAYMANYRDADDPIDLFNNPRTKVQCKLVALQADAAEQSHCWLED